MPDPLLPSMLENQDGKMGSEPSPTPLYSVPWISFFLGYSRCEDNLNILLYYLELGPHFGEKKKKRKAKQTNGDPLFCDDAVTIKFEAFFETAVLGINQSMCQSDVPLTFL